MADNFRYRYGETNPVRVAFKAGVAVGVSDLSYQDSADSYTVKSANNIAWDVSLAQTQIDFVASFLGAAAQRYDGTTGGTTTGTNAIGIKDGFLRVDTAGIFEYACAAGSTFNAGDLVGPAQQAGGVQLLDPQTVVAVAAKNQAIGRVERAASNASSVLVRIFTTKLGTINN